MPAAIMAAPAEPLGMLSGSAMGSGVISLFRIHGIGAALLINAPNNPAIPAATNAMLKRLGPTHARGSATTM